MTTQSAKTSTPARSADTSHTPSVSAASWANGIAPPFTCTLMLPNSTGADTYLMGIDARYPSDANGCVFATEYTNPPSPIPNYMQLMIVPLDSGCVIAPMSSGLVITSTDPSSGCCPWTQQPFVTQDTPGGIGVANPCSVFQIDVTSNGRLNLQGISPPSLGGLPVWLSADPNGNVPAIQAALSALPDPTGFNALITWGVHDLAAVRMPQAVPLGTFEAPPTPTVSNGMGQAPSVYPAQPMTIGQAFMPWFAVQDSAYTAAQQIASWPYYVVTHTRQWVMVIDCNNPGTTHQAPSTQFTVGFSETDSTTLTETLSITLEDDEGFSFEGASDEMKETISMSLSVAVSTSTTQMSQQTNTYTINTPPQTYAAMYMAQDCFLLWRAAPGSAPGSWELMNTWTQTGPNKTAVAQVSLAPSATASTAKASVTVTPGPVAPRGAPQPVKASPQEPVNASERA